MANSNQNVETPIAFIKAVEKFYDLQFKYDMAASSENAKCNNFFTEYDNSLNIDWPIDDWCWLNPPFRNLTKWIIKCYEESQRGVKIISIWPLSGDHNQILSWENSSVNVVHGRLWDKVRSVMLCKWDTSWPSDSVIGSLWKNNELIRLW